MKTTIVSAAALSLCLVHGALASEPAPVGKDPAVLTAADAMRKLRENQKAAPDPHAAQPLGDQTKWVTENDYPSEALRENWVGTVYMILTIDRSGRVEKCTVSVSSGHELLDVTSCNLLTQRAIFKPATDKRNRPVVGSFNRSVRWTIPAEDKPLVPFSVEFTVVVEADGSVSDCRVVRLDGIPKEERAKYKSRCDRPGIMKPLTDDAGNPVRRLVRSRSSVTIEPVP